jgi:transposase
MKANSDTTTKLYIGLDVHKEQTSVAVAMPGARGEVRSHGNVATSQIALERLLRRLAKAHGVALGELHVCYEAGGCGMWIARRLAAMGIECTVVAPSLIPSKSGDLVKTDSRAERDRPEAQRRAPQGWPRRPSASESSYA